MSGSPSLVRAMRGPVTLITLGVLFALNNFTEYRFNQTWPVLLIVFGLMTLLCRSVEPAPPAPAPPAYNWQAPGGPAAPPPGGYRQSQYGGTAVEAAPGPAKGGFGTSAAQRPPDRPGETS